MHPNIKTIVTILVIALVAIWASNRIAIVGRVVGSQ